MQRDEAVRWRELCESAIDVSTDRTDWHSGRAHDVLRIDNGPVIAATVGGVWVIDPNTGEAYPASDAWPALEVHALCASPIDREHVFACAAAPIALYETDLAAVDPLLEWSPIAVPADVKIVHAAATTRTTPFRVIIATNAGIYWSELAVGNYAWNRAFISNTGMPFNTEATGVAVGKDIVIVGPAGTSSELYRGAWDGQGRLMFGSVTFPPHGQPDLATKLDRLSVASCKDQPESSYVLGFAGDGSIVGVLRSTDDGINWSWCSFVRVDGNSLKKVGGDGSAGGRIKHVAVSAHDPNGVTLPGLEASISTDGGGQWLPVHEPHHDVHRVYFDPGDPGSRSLLCASDGGVFRSINQAQSWDGKLNRSLRTLQCYTSSLVREFWGCMDASDTARGGPLVVTGLQDNGNVMLSLAQGSAPRWTKITGGDGGYCQFLSSGSIVFSAVSGQGVNAQIAASPSWQGKEIPDAAFDQPSPRPGIPGPRLYTFRKAWTDSFMNSSLSGLATSDAEPGILYGLFGRFSGQVTNWAQLCKLDLDRGDSISALAEANRVIWAATARGRLFAISWTSYPLDRTLPVINGFIRPADPVINELLSVPAPPVPPAPGSSPPELVSTALSIEPGGDLWVLAAWKDPTADVYRSRVFQVVSISWKEMTFNLADASGFGPRLQAIYADRLNVYVAGDGAVYRLGPGSEWFDVSAGLPTGFQGSDFAELKLDGGPALLLSTFGRSVWRTDLQN